MFCIECGRSVPQDARFCVECGSAAAPDMVAAATRALPTPAVGSPAVADWYADPTGRHQLRYWDGQHWTDHAATTGGQIRDPYVARPSDVIAGSTGVRPATASATATGGGPAYGGPNGTTTRARTARRWPLILVVVGLALFGLCGTGLFLASRTQTGEELRVETATDCSFLVDMYLKYDLKLGQVGPSDDRGFDYARIRDRAQLRFIAIGCGSRE